LVLKKLSIDLHCGGIIWGFRDENSLNECRSCRFTGAANFCNSLDRYQDSLLEVIKAKINGIEPSIAVEEERVQVLNLMEALICDRRPSRA
jgi:hypothetical protein